VFLWIRGFDARVCIFAVFFDWSWVHLDSHAGTGSMAEEGAEGTGRIEGPGRRCACFYCTGVVASGLGGSTVPIRVHTSARTFLFVLSYRT
jgi:hypothetical protein